MIFNLNNILMLTSNTCYYQVTSKPSSQTKDTQTLQITILPRWNVYLGTHRGFPAIPADPDDVLSIHNATVNVLWVRLLSKHKHRSLSQTKRKIAGGYKSKHKHARRKSSDISVPAWIWNFVHWPTSQLENTEMTNWDADVIIAFLCRPHYE